MRKCFYTPRRTNQRSHKEKAYALTPAWESFFFFFFLNGHVSTSWIKKKGKKALGTKDYIKYAVTGMKSVTEQLFSTPGNKTDQNSVSLIFSHLNASHRRASGDPSERCLVRELPFKKVSSPWETFQGITISARDHELMKRTDKEQRKK